MNSWVVQGAGRNMKGSDCSEPLPKITRLMIDANRSSNAFKTAMQATGFEPVALDWQKPVCFHLHHAYLRVTYLRI